MSGTVRGTEGVLGQLQGQEFSRSLEVIRNGKAFLGQRDATRRPDNEPEAAAVAQGAEAGSLCGVGSLSPGSSVLFQAGFPGGSPDQQRSCPFTSHKHKAGEAFYPPRLLSQLPAPLSLVKVVEPQPAPTPSLFCKYSRL